MISQSTWDTCSGSYNSLISINISVNADSRQNNTVDKRSKVTNNAKRAG